MCLVLIDPLVLSVSWCLEQGKVGCRNLLQITNNEKITAKSGCHCCHLYLWQFSVTQSDVCLHKSATSAVTSYPGPALSLAATAQWPRAEDATVVSGEKQGGTFS